MSSRGRYRCRKRGPPASAGGRPSRPTSEPARGYRVATMNRRGNGNMTVHRRAACRTSPAPACRPRGRRLLLHGQRLEEGRQAGSLEPLHDGIEAAGKRVEVGGSPDIHAGAERLQNCIVPIRLGDGSARAGGMGELFRKGRGLRNRAHRDMRRLSQIVRHLDREASAGREQARQLWQQRLVAAHPLQRGIGEDRSQGPGSLHSSMAASSNRTAGSRSFAALIISAALSTPTMDARRKAPASSSVELPGPQPRSAARATSPGGTACKRSRAGRVRSSSNFRYCRADQATLPPL